MLRLQGFQGIPLENSRVVGALHLSAVSQFWGEAFSGTLTAAIKASEADKIHFNSKCPVSQIATSSEGTANSIPVQYASIYFVNQSNEKMECGYAKIVLRRGISIRRRCY